MSIIMFESIYSDVGLSMFWIVYHIALLMHLLSTHSKTD